jgi:hypothetical protein
MLIDMLAATMDKSAITQSTPISTTPWTLPPRIRAAVSLVTIVICGV